MPLYCTIEDHRLLAEHCVHTCSRCGESTLDPLSDTTPFPAFCGHVDAYETSGGWYCPGCGDTQQKQFNFTAGESECRQPQS